MKGQIGKCHQTLQYDYDLVQVYEFYGKMKNLKKTKIWNTTDNKKSNK